MIQSFAAVSDSSGDQVWNWQRVALAFLMSVGNAV